MNALVPVNAAPALTVTDVEKVANAIARGGLFGSKDPYAVLTLCLLAQAEGQHPAVVFRDYHIIQGKPAKKADAMLRDFVSAGGKVEWHQLDDAVADATFSHPGGGTVRIDWTMKRANQAGLATAMWKKYPRQMLRSRVISEGVRTVFPGATSGLYVPEEVQQFEGATETHHNAPAETRDAPAMDHAEPREPEHQEQPSEKVKGISKIKASVREMKARGDEATDLDAFEAIVAEYAAPCEVLEASQHEWWIGRDRDGNEFEGVRAWLARRREELSANDGTFKMLIDSMKQCETKPALEHWMEANETILDTLDDAERRRFELAYDLHESGITAMDQVSA